MAPEMGLVAYSAGRRSINVVVDRCKECGLCISVCPVKILAKGPEPNAHGYRPPVATDPGKCIGCRLCEYVCPEFAIFVG